MSCLKSGGSVSKLFFKKNSHDIVDIQLQSVQREGSLARNARFGTSTSQAGRSFLRFVVKLCFVVVVFLW